MRHGFGLWLCALVVLAPLAATSGQEPPSAKPVQKGVPPVAQLVIQMEKGSTQEIIEAAQMLRIRAEVDLEQGRNPGITLAPAIPILKRRLFEFGTGPHPLASAADGALRAIGEASISVYVDLLSAPEANVRLSQVCANGITTILKGVKKPSPGTRRSLDKAIPVLVPLAASDVAASLIFPFTQALEAIGKPAVPKLVEALNNEEPNVQTTLVNLLGRIGGPVQQIEPALRKLEASSDPRLRKSVAEALERMGLRPAPDLPPIPGASTAPPPAAPPSNPIARERPKPRPALGAFSWEGVMVVSNLNHERGDSVSRKLKGAGIPVTEYRRECPGNFALIFGKGVPAERVQTILKLVADLDLRSIAYSDQDESRGIHLGPGGFPKAPPLAPLTEAFLGELLEPGLTEQGMIDLVVSRSGRVPTAK